MSEFDRDISRFLPRHYSFCHLALNNLSATDLPDNEMGEQKILVDHPVFVCIPDSNAVRRLDPNPGTDSMSVSRIRKTDTDARKRKDRAGLT